MKHLRRLAPYARKRKYLIMAAIASSLISQGAFLIMPKLLGDIVDQVFQGGQRDRLAFYGLLILFLSVVRGAFNFLEIIAGARCGQAVLLDLRQDLYAHLCRLSFTYFDKTRTGQLISRITSDLEPVSMFLTWGFRMIFKNILLFVGVVVICLRMHVTLTLVSMSALPLLTLTAMVIGGKIRPAYESAREQLGVLTSLLQENIQGIRLIKMYVKEKAEIARFEQESETLREKTYKAQRLDAIYYPITGLWAGLASLLVLWYGGLQVINGSLTLGEYVAFETYLIFITLPTRMLGFMVSAMLRTDASMERVHAIIDAVPDITSPPRAASHSPVSGRVDFEDVSFGYTHESSTLTDLAFTIEAEETVGIIGATGCGKSTLISLIPRFYDPQRGRVLIDGHDVRQWELSALRRQIGIVFQDTFLFSGTLRDNIAYANPDTDDEDVARVARLAALDEFIQQLPEGYDTVVGERGERLSGGQQQRLSIARTLLWQPRILLLDDCTSSLDTHTEYQIQQNLESERKGRTTIIIAQRASALSTADRVFVLESGRVVETGTPSSLARDTGSLYARLRASQGPSGTDDPLPTTPEGVP
ncbi:MAG: hypothetical protein AUJ92_01800 [Armatimonadetes bacterium CG2_30_59_28]|nr:ABC transporter ATP-binding protein [Armatimonadota bacterium]OIO98240.1 MAG: hypothetical protein AUJ92_01800 [Armatimonadetes bacterium CG2_30_59_28]PIU65632.1 MAG: ABC transporter ATP-binding protein [Armatimonadetes bacterium CG07_land_8_20_14_0_80_59_28]PIX44075.1 MAG: ABC transporter ATP-binding protein [Armatimonadetes bacterium CG_4_8_14_3_um_filter_58_9]PJB70702.1 MAG: ABC transporter ATP-binding protein [Armatimonadetes bacterium CG_4_9_14_3_um_filter_58_7]